MQPNKLLIEHFDVFIFQYLFYVCIYKIGIDQEAERLCLTPQQVGSGAFALDPTNKALL